METKSSNPTTSYLMKGSNRGGTSSNVKGGQKDILVGGAKDSQKEIVGGKRWDISGPRKMNGGRKM